MRPRGEKNRAPRKRCCDVDARNVFDDWNRECCAGIFSNFFALAKRAFGKNSLYWNAVELCGRTIELNRVFRQSNPIPLHPNRVCLLELDLRECVKQRHPIFLFIFRLKSVVKNIKCGLGLFFALRNLLRFALHGREKQSRKTGFLLNSEPSGHMAQCLPNTSYALRSCLTNRRKGKMTVV